MSKTITELRKDEIKALREREEILRDRREEIQRQIKECCQKRHHLEALVNRQTTVDEMIAEAS